jgi:hypothetical protein
MYHLMPFAPPVATGEEIWDWQGRRYLLRAVLIQDYQKWMRCRSPKWDTVMLTSAAYQQVARPFETLIRQRNPLHPRSAEEAGGGLIEVAGLTV